MAKHSILAKRFSVEEESALNQNQQAEMEASHQKRWLCNELVHELCLKIPVAKTAERILLTSHNVYAYLEPRFNKKLNYRDLIVFLKAKLNAKKRVEIRIDQLILNKESEPIVLVNQEQANEKFELETNQFRVQIQIIHLNSEAPMRCWIYGDGGQFENVHLFFFLRLIAQIQPIRLNLGSCHTPTTELVRFMSTQSDWIDSIALWDYKFNSELIYGALSKYYNKLQIYGSLSEVKVPKLIQWLNNNGQTKKYLFPWNLFDEFDNGLARLIKELKKEFAHTTGKSRFVILLKLRQRLDEFTLSNELTGERLELRLKNTEYGWYVHTLSRSSNNELGDNEDDLDELSTSVMTHICLS